MDLEMEKIKDTLTVRLKGELDLASIDDLRTKIDQKIQKDGIETLIFDLNSVTFMDSSGLGLILGRYRKMLSRGGKTYIVRAGNQVAKILEYSGVRKIIPVYETEKDILRID